MTKPSRKNVPDMESISGWLASIGASELPWPVTPVLIIHLITPKVCLFVLDEALRPSQQIFSHVGTDPLNPWYYQYFLVGKCILLKDTTQRPE